MLSQEEEAQEENPVLLFFWNQKNRVQRKVVRKQMLSETKENKINGVFLFKWFVAACFKNRSSWRTACFKNPLFQEFKEAVFQEERFLKQAEEEKSGSWNKQKKSDSSEEERFLKQAATNHCSACFKNRSKKSC